MILDTCGMVKVDQSLFCFYGKYGKLMSCRSNFRRAASVRIQTNLHSCINTKKII